MPRRCLLALVVLATLAAAQRAHARGCLAADTPILTPTGSVPVQDLHVGDSIYSITQGRLTSAKVVARFEVTADQILEISVAGRILRVTPEHPMQTAGGVFVEAGRLHPGDHLFLWNGNALQDVPIQSITTRSTREPAYNLMVSPGGTYLADGIAVHNKGCFLPETPILLADGTQTSISSIHPGDHLMAFTQEGKIVTATVQQIVTHEVDEYCHITTDYLELDVTPEHPFFVGDGTFKTVEALVPGDSVYACDGEHLTPQKIISIQRVFRHVTVYNLQTDEPHTFFAHGIAVHNKGGGGGHGGGGHGGGGGHSSGSHYYGGHSGSSTQPSTGGGLICPLSFVLIVLLGTIYKALHRSTSSYVARDASMASAFKLGSSPGNLDYVIPRVLTNPKAAQTTKLLQHLSQQDSQVAPAALQDLVHGAFIQLQKCWQSREYTPMQPLLTPDLYRSHCLQLADMVSQHEIDHIDKLNVQRVDIVNIRYTKEPCQREFTALITAIAQDYYTDDRTGKFIRGDRGPAQFQEFWIFHFINQRWLLREIEQSRESDLLREKNLVEGMTDDQLQAIAGAHPSLPSNGKPSRIDVVLQSLTPTDPHWDKAAMSSRARDVFVQVILAYEACDPSSVAPEALPEAMAKLQVRCNLMLSNNESIEYRNLCVRKVDIVLVNQAKSEFTARIVAHAQQASKRAGQVVYQDDAKLPFIQFLSFTYADDKWKLQDILNPADASAVLRTSPQS